MLPLFLLGRKFDLGAAALDDPSREGAGLILILTGIEGLSFLEQQVALGLADAGFAGRIRIVDWTTGRPWLMFRHLRDSERHRGAARDVVAQVRGYHARHPAGPVHLVGYSAGAEVVLQALDPMPAGRGAIVESAVLIAAACSRNVPIAARLDRTRLGMTHYWSPWDRIVLGLLMRIFGTTDGVHAPAAGCVGFRHDLPENQDDRRGSARFREFRFTWRWLRQFHYGGHMAFGTRIWARETLGASLRRGEPEGAGKWEGRCGP